MKKIFLLSIVLLPFCSQAQFTKGDKVLGGTLQFLTQDQATEDNREYQYRNFSVLPNAGLFVNDKVELGGMVGFNSLYQNSEGGSNTQEYKSTSQSLQAGLYAQRYLTLADKFLFALLVQSHFSRGNNISSRYDPSTGEYTENKTLSYSINSSLRPTFIFFPTPHWGFRLSLASLNHVYNRNLSTDDKSNQFTLLYGSVGLGVSYYFRKLKE